MQTPLFIALCLLPPRAQGSQAVFEALHVQGTEKGKGVYLYRKKGKVMWKLKALVKDTSFLKTK